MNTCRAILLLIFAFALLLGLVVLHEVQDVDPMPLGTDMAEYYRQANLLLDGRWPDASVYYFHPLYPITWHKL